METFGIMSMPIPMPMKISIPMDYIMTTTPLLVNNNVIIFISSYGFNYVKYVEEAAQCL